MTAELQTSEKLPPVGPYRLVVFDWDGTILDTTAAIVISIQYAAEKLGLPVPSAKKCRSVIGLGWRDAIRIVAPTCPPEEFQQFGAFYVERYKPEEPKVHLFEGIRALFEDMRAKGITLAIATGKSRRGLNGVLELTGIGEYFSETATADENPSKPDPAMLERIGLATGFTPEETIMVGDTTHDLAMARAWGCRGIGVTYGAMTREMLSREPAAAIVDSVAELRAALGLD